MKDTDFADKILTTYNLSPHNFMLYIELIKGSNDLILAIVMKYHLMHVHPKQVSRIELKPCVDN